MHLKDGFLGLFANEDSEEFHGELLGGSRPPFLQARQKSRKEQKPPNTPPFGMISILHFVKKQPKGLSSSCSCHADNRSPESDICCPCSVSDTQSSGPCRLSLSKLFRSSSFLWSRILRLAQLSDEVEFWGLRSCRMEYEENEDSELYCFSLNIIWYIWYILSLVFFARKLRQSGFIFIEFSYNKDVFSSITI